ncbi:hypothetical protein CAAN1_24S00694 [[Candida] anglica]|uniref:Uncharacterized protein n=1 Tax=[Candida] anglica TaxID=148631 RepID=A0ABP0EEZ9_9ASCO
MVKKFNLKQSSCYCRQQRRTHESNYTSEYPHL